MRWGLAYGLALTLVACSSNDGPGARDAAGVDSGADAATTEDAATEDSATGDAATEDAATEDDAATRMDAGEDAAVDDAATDAGTDAAERDAAGGCVDNRECSPTDYCAADSCDGPGTCTMRPEICSGFFDPVCGCDGMTYGNGCNAASRGVRVASSGACGDTRCDIPSRVGCCFTDAECRLGTVCRRATCSPGGEGTCVAAPTDGQCWVDSDCPSGGTCLEANQCPCGSLCIVPDAPGRCALSI
ncbi:MAG: hypothetical protein AAGE52_31100 [Myxococcota bacterium]